MKDIKIPLNEVRILNNKEVVVVGYGTIKDSGDNFMHIVRRKDDSAFASVDGLSVTTLLISPFFLRQAPKELKLSMTYEEAERLYALLNFGEVNFDGVMTALNERIRAALRDKFYNGNYGLGNRFERDVRNKGEE